MDKAIKVRHTILQIFMQKNGFNQVDADYWKEKGWTGKLRPWN